MKWLELALDFLKAIKLELSYLFYFLAGKSFQKQESALEAAKNSLKRMKRVSLYRKQYNDEKAKITKKWFDRRDAFIRLKRMRENSDNKQ